MGSKRLHPHSRAQRITTSCTLLAFVASACGGKTTTPPNTAGSAAPASSPSGTQPLMQLKDAPAGLTLRLSNGQAGAAPIDRSKLGPASKLSDADTQQLLSRTKPIAAEGDDQKSFALRDRSLPPPRTGDVIKTSFPVPASSLLPPVTNEVGKDLRVLRFMPEGEVPVAPELSITFSDAMVPITSQDDAAKNVPVTLTPQPAGKWRWLGTRTLLFDPAVRFPQATTYKVEVPAGTKGINGNPLKAPVHFSFTTPSVTVTSKYPEVGPARTDTPMFIGFDQKIDAQAVLAKVVVKAGGKTYSVRALDAAEIEKDARIKVLVAGAKSEHHEGRYIAFRALDALPIATAVTVTLPSGTPSAEGPNLTKSDQSFSFSTYHPLKIDDARCGWDKKCRPGQGYGIRFNNSLDEEKFEDAQVTVTPAVPGLKVVASSNYVSLQGATAAHTNYKITVAANVTDEYGQTLGKAESFDWNVGAAEPAFFGPNGTIVLDPAATSRSLDVFSTNYESFAVELYKVTPEQYPAYANFMRNQWNRDKPPARPGVKVFDGTIKATAGKDKLVETKIALGKALDKDGLGHVFAIIKPQPWKERYEPPTLIVWAQATKLGIDASVDHEMLQAFATDLQTGKAAAGVEISLRDSGVPPTRTDAGGLATVSLPTQGGRGGDQLLAKRGSDVAFVTDGNGWWNEYNSWVRRDPGQHLSWYITDDRKLYKPNEEVHLKGWLRMVDQRKQGDVGLASDVAQVKYTVNDSQGNKLTEGVTAVSMTGGFDFAFTLPKTPNLGHAYVQLEAKGKSGSLGSAGHSFQIEEFRTPEFEVSARTSEGPHVIGGGGDLTVAAKYYAGGVLAGADATWNLTATETTFTPPNRDEFVFGKWIPWWGVFSMYDDEGGGWRGGRRGGYKPPQSWNHQGKTDASGEHVLHLDFLAANPEVPMAIAANASVQDVNRQAWNAGTAVLVHPALAYVGLRAARTFVDKGTPFTVDVVGVDLDGKALVGREIVVTAARKDWEYKKGRYIEKRMDPQTCKLTSTADVGKCEFATNEGGTYEITAVITDEKGRHNTTMMNFWVTGGDRVPAREVTQEKVEIVPNKKEYAAGETAELLVMAPFAPSEAVITWRRSGIVKTERLSLTGTSATVKVPIADAMVPNLVVHVNLVGEAPRLGDNGLPDAKLPKRPAFASGEINLPVPPKQRALTVLATPAAAKVEPGATTSVDVVVKDAAGKPVPDAEVALMVVDEAVLALTGARHANPLDSFYPQRGSDTQDAYLRAWLKLAKPERDQFANRAESKEEGAIIDGINTTAADMTGGGGMAMPSAAPASEAAPQMERSRGAAPGAPPPPPAPMKKGRVMLAAKGDGDDASRAQSSAPIAVRSNFNPLAAFAPAQKTNANGSVALSVKLPDNLTRYRIVALAVAGGKQYGKGESALTARLPLMVRAMPPRFLNFGDVFALPVVLQNQTDAPLKVRLAVRATNAKLTDGGGREVTIPANERVEVQFPAAAALAGKARFQFVSAAGSFADASEIALPVWTPATTEAFATYGVIDKGAIRQPVALPGKVVTEFGGVDVTTASTNLQALTDAVLYLVSYPYECAEQRASRILAIAALRDVLTAFKVKAMPTPAEMEKRVALDLERLTQMQNGDGGFAFWERGRPSWPFLTVHVTNALVRAKNKGYSVPGSMLSRALAYLQDIESHYEREYSEEVRRTISAYALYVRRLAGQMDVAKAQRLFRSAGGADKLSMEAVGWLLGAVAGQKGAEAERQALLRHATNKVAETAGAANFTNSYRDGAHLLLASDRRVDAIMLESLISEQKDLDLIPKLVTGLLGHRKAGKWLNTEENAFALLALDTYFRTYEKTTPDFVARLWFGDAYAGDHAFKGRTTEYSVTSIAMRDVAARDKSDLIIAKDGDKGRLYYRIGMTYAPADLKLPAADYGFVVERRYEGVDNPSDVVRMPDGSWKIKSGTRVRVKLKMANENRRYHVALVDPLPAGLEPLNPALATTGPIPTSADGETGANARGGRYWWWWGPWYEHQNMRDERVEAFASLLWEGVHSYEYVARATVPGTFVVPPAKAEEMYMPETFGRSASDKVVVE